MSESLARPILKEGKKFKVRILRPSEYSLLRQGAVKNHYQVQLDALLYTGMRYIEMRRLHSNPGWLDSSGFVYLPQEASGKALNPVEYFTRDGRKKIRRPRSQLNRWVKLNPQGLMAISLYLRGPQLPVWQTWTIWFKEWAERIGLEPAGLGPKTTRKTWESWLTFYYRQDRFLEIVQSQGHTTGTSLGHYLSMPFLPKDKEEMEPYVKGMF